jgi:hypothetical protein
MDLAARLLREAVEFCKNDGATLQISHGCCCATLQRYFMGLGNTDCWSGARGTRCIRGGSQCSFGRYGQIPNWTIWMAAA